MNEETVRGVPASLFPTLANWIDSTNRVMEYREPDAPDILDVQYLHVRVDSYNSKEWAAVFPKLQKVRYLDIKGVITDRILEGVGKIVNLERLDAGRVAAKSLDALSELKKLEYLALSHLSAIDNIEVISQLRCLRSLYLGIGPKVRSLSGLGARRLPHLKCVLLSGSNAAKALNLDDISHIAMQTGLEYFLPWYVKCDDPDLGCLEKVANLKVFGCCDRRWWRDDQLQALEDKGVTIEFNKPAKSTSE
ncbi:MAG: hypothetical protein AB8G18_15180 [Gammaproteobacteria bacterium]